MLEYCNLMSWCISALDSTGTIFIDINTSDVELTQHIFRLLLTISCTCAKAIVAVTNGSGMNVDDNSQLYNALLSFVPIEMYPFTTLEAKYF